MCLQEDFEQDLNSSEKGDACFYDVLKSSVMRPINFEGILIIFNNCSKHI